MYICGMPCKRYRALQNLGVITSTSRKGTR